MRKSFSILIIVIFMLSLFTGCSGKKTASQGDTVLVHYTGSLEDGTVFDSSREREPFEVTIGSGNAIAGFENGIEGLSVGDVKTITIPPEEAYGSKRPELIMEVPKTQIQGDIKPEIGGVLQMRQQDGRIMNATITEIKGDIVTIDANHPLADKTLIFEIEVVEIL